MCGDGLQVEQDADHQMCEPPDYLYTLGVSTCIGIGVCDRRQKKGFLVHASSGVHSDYNLIDGLISDVESVCPSMNDVIIKATGAYDEADRDYVRKALEPLERCGATIEYKWCKPKQYAEIQVVPVDGNVSVEIDELSPED